jgi:FtsH-binding integral membrane protein
MNWAHLHLLLNHIPVLGIPFGLLLLLFGAVRRSRELVEAALWTFALVALLALPVYLTGDPAKDIVMGHPGVSEPAIERHEDAALFALVAALALGALSALGLVITAKTGSAPRWLTMTALVVALAASLIMAWTANLGGQIHHDELRAPGPAGGAGGEPGERPGDD